MTESSHRVRPVIAGACAITLIALFAVVGGIDEADRSDSDREAPRERRLHADREGVARAQDASSRSHRVQNLDQRDGAVHLESNRADAHISREPLREVRNSDRSSKQVGPGSTQPLESALATLEPDAVTARADLDALLRSPDLQDRLSGVDALAEVDLYDAQAEAEALLHLADDEDRWDVYDRMMDLAGTDTERIGVVIRALSDSSASVRDQAAYWLSTEDVDLHPEILSGLRRAFATERDPDARATIESALETVDPEFVSPSSLDESTDEG